MIKKKIEKKNEKAEAIASHAQFSVNNRLISSPRVGSRKANSRQVITSKWWGHVGRLIHRIGIIIIIILILIWNWNWNVPSLEWIANLQNIRRFFSCFFFRSLFSCIRRIHDEMMTWHVFLSLAVTVVAVAGAKKKEKKVRRWFWFESIKNCCGNYSFRKKNCRLSVCPDTEAVVVRK